MSAISLSSRDQGQVLPVRTFEGQGDGVDSVVWHPDGQRIISGSSTGELRIWDVETGLQLGEPIKGHTAAVYALDISRDGTMLASGSWDRTLRLWHCDTRTSVHAWEDDESQHQHHQHEDRIYDVHFSPDAKRLVSGSGDGTLRVWNVASGTLAFEPVKCRGYVWAVRYSPDGGRIASGGDGVQIRDVHEDGVRLVHAIEQSVNALGWTHDGEQLIAGALGHVIIWDASSGEELRTWEAHRRWIDLSLSPTTTHLVTCDGYGHQSSVMVFDIETKEQVGTYEHGNTVADVAYSPSGKYIATACEDRVYLWDAPHSLSPGSSALDLPATAPIQEVRAHDQFVELFSDIRGSFLDLSAMSRPLGTTAPSKIGTKAMSQRKRIFRDLGKRFRGPHAAGTTEHSSYAQHITADDQASGLSRHRFSTAFQSARGAFRRRNPSLNEHKENQEERISGGDGIAEARTRPIYAFVTGPLPDEIERGWLFHLASYICFCQRDPNANGPETNVSNVTSRPPDREPHVSSSTNGTARVRATVERPLTALRSCLRPGTNGPPSTRSSAVTADPAPHTVPDPTLVQTARPARMVASPSSGPIKDFGSTMATDAQQPP